MDGIGNFISMLDYVLDTKRKRHITGGILLSASLLFGGLALTVITINDEEEEDE
ncbi:MAG: histidine kinase [Eubacteriales bacterium]|nr:histidine kinase [Eubacteriales bacterium]